METKNNNDEIEIDLRQLLSIIWNKIIIIILVGIIFAISAFLATKMLIAPVYQSTTKLYVLNRANNGTTTLTDLQTSTQLTKDYKILVTSTPVTQAVIKQLKLNMSPGELAGSISVSTPADTRVLQITVSNTDPYKAKEIADAVADISSDSICEVMQIEKVNVIEEGNVPTVPISPNPKKNAMLGGLFGVVMTCIIVLLKSLLNDTIKSSEDIERYLGLSTLAMIPLCEDMEDNRGQKNRRARKKSKKNAKRR